MENNIPSESNGEIRSAPDSKPVKIPHKFKNGDLVICYDEKVIYYNEIGLKSCGTLFKVDDCHYGRWRCFNGNDWNIVEDIGVYPLYRLVGVERESNPEIPSHFMMTSKFSFRSGASEDCLLPYNPTMFD